MRSTAIGLALVWAVLPCCRSGDAQLADAMPFHLEEASILQLQSAMEAGTVSSRDLVEMYLARIAAYDDQGPAINAMIHVNPRAAEQALALDRERAMSGPRGPLHGIPMVVKDNYDTADMPTTGGSRSLEGMMAPDDAFQVRKLREAGAVILGKTNLHEFAYGITTISSMGGQTLNPYDTTRNPGGSSGGTGAAVAANFAAAGMGSDTCGSIRIPSSHNSLVGLRATRGLSSRDGIIPLSTTQDVAGPLARSVEDLAIVLDATVGYDPSDPITALGVEHVPASYTGFLRSDSLRGARIGVLEELFGSESESDEVNEIVRAAAADMALAGAEVVQLSMPDLRDLLRGGSVINMEFKFDLDRYLQSNPGAPFQSLEAIVESGLFADAVGGTLRRSAGVETQETEAYKERLLRRDEIRLAVLAAMADLDLDAVLYPTITREAATVGERQQGSNCSLSATSGLPAISVPAGFTEGGLPVGVELLGRPFSEGVLVGLAYSYEQATHHRRPPNLD